MTSFKTLHILNKAPGHQRHLMCLSAIDPEDAILLIENGVLALSQSLQANATCFALEPDVVARGLVASTESEVKMVSFDDMVALTSAAGNVISW